MCAKSEVHEDKRDLNNHFSLGLMCWCVDVCVSMCNVCVKDSKEQIIKYIPQVPVSEYYYTPAV